MRVLQCVRWMEVLLHHNTKQSPRAFTICKNSTAFRSWAMKNDWSFFYNDVYQRVDINNKLLVENPNFVAAKWAKIYDIVFYLDGCYQDMRSILY